MNRFQGNQQGMLGTARLGTKRTYFVIWKVKITSVSAKETTDVFMAFHLPTVVTATGQKGQLLESQNMVETEKLQNKVTERMEKGCTQLKYFYQMFYNWNTPVTIAQAYIY